MHALRGGGQTPVPITVVGLLTVAAANIWQLTRLFPGGGSIGAAAARGLGPGASFCAIGVLAASFTLAVGTAVTATAGAVISLFPVLVPIRLQVALSLIALVAWIARNRSVGRRVVPLVGAAAAALALAEGAACALTPAPWHDCPVPESAQPIAAVVTFVVAACLPAVTGLDSPVRVSAELSRRLPRRTRLGGIAFISALATVGVVAIALGPPACRWITANTPTSLLPMCRSAALPGDHGLLRIALGLTVVLLLTTAAASVRGASARLGPAGSPATPYRPPTAHLAVVAVVVTVAGGKEAPFLAMHAGTLLLALLISCLALASLARRRGRTVAAAVNASSAAAVVIALCWEARTGWPLMSAAAGPVVGLLLHLYWVRSGGRPNRTASPPVTPG
ncbi:hypothetical protein [Kitasatospora sp. NPDC091207]|uniref:hypothetical protein n=1 Tax=Kitasatospora sp. NPDC091207 TaxID=3364083 RepID=UPI0038127AF5